jgi:hypothetical protein
VREASLGLRFEVFGGWKSDGKTMCAVSGLRCGAALSVSQTDQGSDVWEDIWARAVSP